MAINGPGDSLFEPVYMLHTARAMYGGRAPHKQQIRGEEQKAAGALEKLIAARHAAAFSAYREIFCARFDAPAKERD